MLGPGRDEATKSVKWEKRKKGRGWKVAKEERMEKPDGNGVSYAILPAPRSGFARREMESCSTEKDLSRLSSHTVLDDKSQGKWASRGSQDPSMHGRTCPGKGDGRSWSVLVPGAGRAVA